MYVGSFVEAVPRRQILFLRRDFEEMAQLSRSLIFRNMIAGMRISLRIVIGEFMGDR